MQIEYTIKFEKGGLTIIESIDSGGAAASVKPDAPAVQNSLGANFTGNQPAQSAETSALDVPTNSPVGGGQSNRPKGGSPATAEGGGAPITIIGPFIFLCPPDKPEESHVK